MNVVPGTSTGWYSLLGRVFWYWDISLLFQVFVSGTQLCRLFLSSVEVLIWWSPGKQACCDWTSSLVCVVLGCIFLYLVVLSRLRWICNHEKASAITSFMFPYSVLHVWFNWGVCDFRIILAIELGHLICHSFVSWEVLLHGKHYESEYHVYL